MNSLVKLLGPWKKLKLSRSTNVVNWFTRECLMHSICRDRGTVTSIKKLAVYMPRSANLCRTRKHISYASLKPMIMTSHTPKIILFIPAKMQL